MKTEDQIRDEARIILEFEDSEEALSGVGQITTFNQLGFPGNPKKPDGWYLPKDTNKTAIILETKSEKTDIDTNKCVEEIREYGTIALEKYEVVIGILYNGKHTRVFRNNKPMEVPNELQNKEYYIDIIKDKPLDKHKIYTLTAKINNNLHFNFGVKNLYSRMVFTAAALVAERYSKHALMLEMDFDTLHNSIRSNLNKSLIDSKQQNQKLGIIVEVFSDIRMNYTEDQTAINEFIKDVKSISKAVNSNHWAGEDVMGIFFNEFNRYKGKSEQGQVFTPDHITNFMYRLIDSNKDDYILDAACGSGAFLVKSMSNMIIEAGGVATNKAKEIKANRLFGIENDKEIFALACANMLIHKDGKTNLEYMDSRKEEAGDWIKEKPITKVLMNPPFENKYGWDEIIINVLDNVNQGTMCAIILPDKKLEKASKKFRENLLENHRIKTIVKLPKEVFNEGVYTSIFVIEAGRPQGTNNIIAYNIEKDGLVTVKNQGRQDIHNRWPEIEDYWITSIQNGDEEKYKTKQILDPKESLSWQYPVKPFDIKEKDFNETVTDYLLFKEGIESSKFKQEISNKILYSPNEEIFDFLKTFNISKDSDMEVDYSTWGEFKIEKIFSKIKRPASRRISDYFLGEVPYVASGNYNNAVDSYRQPQIDEELEKGNCISISPVDGSTFYQPVDFLGRGGAGSSIILLYSDNLNEYNGLFLTSVIKSTLTKKYEYSDMANGQTIRKEVIKLPKTKDDEIDWNFMEEYIKQSILNAEESIKFLIDNL